MKRLPEGSVAPPRVRGDAETLVLLGTIAAALYFQVDHLKLKILFLQCPIEQEDVRFAVINDEDACGDHNRRVLQAYSPAACLSQPSSIISHLLAEAFAATPASPSRSIAWALLR